MRTGLVLSGVLAAVMAFAGAAHAQLSSEGGPIQVEADNGEVLYRERKAIYSGNVDVIQGDARLRSDRIEVNYAGGGGSGGGTQQHSRQRVSGSAACAARQVGRHCRFLCVAGHLHSLAVA
jgi:lipopolysaccharide export system protein LptA